MKKFMSLFLSMLVAVFAAASVVAGESCKETKQSCKDEAKAAECKKVAEKCTKDADDAQKSGNSQLADVLKKCATCNTTMAEAYTSGDSEKLKQAQDEYKKLCEEKEKLKKNKTECSSKKPIKITKKTGH